MTKAERWRNGLAGIALLLLYPSVLTVRFHYYAEKVATKVPAVEIAWTNYTQGLTNNKMECEENTGLRVSYAMPEWWRNWRGKLMNALGGLGLSFGFTDGGPFDTEHLLTLGFSLVTPFDDLNSTRSKANNYISGWHDRAAVCTLHQGQTIDDLHAAAPEKVRLHLAELERHWEKIAAAAKAHDAQRGWIALIAWVFILIQLVGFFCLFWLTRDYYRQKRESSAP